MIKVLATAVVQVIIWAFALGQLRCHEEHEGTREQRGEGVQRRGGHVLRIDPEKRAHIGIKIATLTRAERLPQLRTTGQVLDPTPLVTLVAEDATAQVALSASRKEFQRIRKLFEEAHNASTRAFELAEASFKRDEATAAATRLRLRVAWGEVISTRADLGALVRSLANGKAAIVQVEVALSEFPQDVPTKARIVAVTADERAVDAQYLATLPTVDTQSQQKRLLFLLRSAVLSPNTAVIAWIDLAG